MVGGTHGFSQGPSAFFGLGIVQAAIIDQHRGSLKAIRVLWFSGGGEVAGRGGLGWGADARRAFIAACCVCFGKNQTGWSSLRNLSGKAHGGNHRHCLRQCGRSRHFAWDSGCSYSFLQWKHKWNIVTFLLWELLQRNGIVADATVSATRFQINAAVQYCLCKYDCSWNS